MEYIDEDYRPRFQVQTTAGIPESESASASSSASKTQCILCGSVGVVMLACAWMLSGFWQIVMAWIGLSLVLGPFAPINLTGGFIAVGRGHVLPPPPAAPELEPEPKLKTKSQRRSVSSIHSSSNGGSTSLNVQNFSSNAVQESAGRPAREVRASEKSKEDRKFEKKNEVERIRNESDSDENRAENVKEEEEENEASNQPVAAKAEVAWSSSDDMALINALKAFPKDVALRWHKIAAAVPGKSRAQCMKRVAELTQNFRNSKASNE